MLACLYLTLVVQLPTAWQSVNKLQAAPKAMLAPRFGLQWGEGFLSLSQNAVCAILEFLLKVSPARSRCPVCGQLLTDLWANNSW